MQQVLCRFCGLRGLIARVRLDSMNFFYQSCCNALSCAVMLAGVVDPQVVWPTITGYLTSFAYRACFVGGVDIPQRASDGLRV